MRISILISMVFIGLVRAEPDPRHPLPDAVNRLATGMFAALADTEKPTNIVFSPFVSAGAFIQLSDMTVGNARAEINRALGLTGAAEAAPASEAIPARPSSALTVAAGLWRRKDLKVRTEFADGAAARRLDLAEFEGTKAAALPATISDWLAEKLKPQKVAFDGSDIVENPLFVLVNAAVFRAKWKAPIKAVKDGLNFQLPDGTKAVRDSVRGDMSIRVHREPNGVVVGSIPFATEGYDMVFVLPPIKTMDLKPARQAVATPVQLEQLLAKLDLSKPKSHDVELPALNLSQKLNLRRVGAALGIKDLYAPTGKTFTGLFAKEQPEAIQFQAVQAVTLQLDQYGVTATAVETSSAGTIGDVAPLFRVNRPFLFLVRDRALGCVLFVGQVVDPR